MAGSGVVEVWVLVWVFFIVGPQILFSDFISSSS